MASTFVVITTLEEAKEHHKAGLLWWYSWSQGGWVPQSELRSELPPVGREVASCKWAILVEE